MRKFIQQGSKSFHENQGRYSNPYPCGSSQHNDFERGWSQALKRSSGSIFDESGIPKIRSQNKELIDQYESEKHVVYRNEVYRVRDNGAIFREARKSGRTRLLDTTWTFGRPCRSSGYMTFAGQVVHRIVATAFHGEQPGDQHVVDHIDTNRRNNLAENLRWITRLDNILKNPITKRRIELSYGSLEELFKDPSRPKLKGLPKNYEWMRTVSKEEAKASRERIEGWAESSAQPTGRGLSEWVYRDNPISVQRADDATKQSLTPGALQRNWRTPTEFPACPGGQDDDALTVYDEKLVSGETFSCNKLGSSEVVVAELSDSGVLSVITQFTSNPVKAFAIARVVREGGAIIHESGGSFFTLEGAVKAHCETINVPWKEHCERRGLPWGDSIDNYC